MKKIVCLDFDGVVHSYTSGWKGPRTIPDPPVEGVGYFDGYGIGLAGAWEGPLITMKDADRRLRRFPASARRRFARGFAVGVFLRMRMQPSLVQGTPRRRWASPGAEPGAVSPWLRLA